MKIGVADYGMMVWYGGLFDMEQRLADLREIGYDGIERLTCISAEDALRQAAIFHKLGMDFGTVRCQASVELTIQWAAALGRQYVWASVSGKDMDTFCRQVNHMVDVAEGWGVQVGLHNHLGQVVETHEQLDHFMAACPKAKLILDTAHLAGAGGDPVKAIGDYAGRVCALHLKDYKLTGKESESWHERLYFCELGAGELGDANAKVLRSAVDAGYDGWVFVEHDLHLQDPIKDLEISREYLKSAGF